MRTKQGHACRKSDGRLAAVASAICVRIAAEKIPGVLSPMPFNDATQPIMQGKGTASATLEGNTLSISGPSQVCRVRRRKHTFP
jgi:hypothetical protein